MPDFLKDLQDATKKNSPVNSDVTVVNMRSGKNQGKLTVIPVGEADGQHAIYQLNQVAAVAEWISGTKKDGTPYGFSRRNYFFLDPKYYSDKGSTLTQEQMVTLDRIKSKFSTCLNQESTRWAVGVHQMTLIQGIIWNHTDRSTPAKSLYAKVPAVIQLESKNFEKAFNKAIMDMSATLGGYSWLNSMSNRDANRKRYFDIEFYRNEAEGIGYQASVLIKKFDEDAVRTTGCTPDGLKLEDEIVKSTIDKLGNPVKTFLGLPQDGGIWNDEYMAKIEKLLDSAIISANKVEPGVEAQEPVKPNSNEGFKVQSEEAPVPTEVNPAPTEAPEAQPQANGDTIF